MIMFLYNYYSSKAGSQVKKQIGDKTCIGRKMGWTLGWTTVPVQRDKM